MQVLAQLVQNETYCGIDVYGFYICINGSVIKSGSKIRYMFGGKATVPMVIRGQQGIGRGNGGQHSQCVEQFFMHIPGMKVAMPSSPSDAAGLLRTAIRDNNPVMFFEHKALYATKGEVPDDPEFAIPLVRLMY